MRKLIYLSALIFLLSILIAPRIPFQDYPDWIYQAKVFKEILTSSPQYISEFSIRPPVVPNSAVTVIMGYMNFIFSPDIAGRIIVVIDFLLIFFVLRKIFKIGEVSVSIAESLSLLFTLSVYFFYGFLSFNLGLGLFLLVALYPLASANRKIGILIYALIFLGLYYIHFIILFVTVSTLLAFRLILKKHKYPNIKYTLLSLLPVIVLYTFYLLGPSRDLASQTIWKYNIAGKIIAYINSVSIIYRFNDFSSNSEVLFFAGLNIILLVGLISFLYAQAKGKFREVLVHEYSIIGYAFWVGALLTPFQIAGFGYKGDRFFWIGFIFIILATLALSRPYSISKTRMAVIIVSIITVVRSLTLLIQGYDDYGVESRLRTAIPRDTLFSSYMVKYDYPEYFPDRGWFRKIMDKSFPSVVTAHRIPIYLFMERDQIFKGIFKTGIIKVSSADCDPMKVLRGGNIQNSPECQNLLFMSPGGIGENLISETKLRFRNVVLDKEFLYASQIQN